ncbi:hypothetical protein COU19_00590 [Candidatus Kaiserbacteria bacterium CG10_big_fil_rev_8_21_14_0_10_56_12]|uniref:Uncharacterized protein n=1 Tax=Candidatus Kaiserbacteria bacterium CG10_big_fil_rev_8_21_14_0_10_56_12 TaxID=1974611 RepID=A0A2H0UCE8_9BACT|nr:MAG: hypothetical protein COU19_00590 [Candidatus Kaiserbacteria bacterium CG10_big_fil_rev_8_21_14_0_10_56_12]
MSRSSTLIVLGVLTMIAPLSGVPSALRTLFLVVVGASVMGIGLAMRTARDGEPRAHAPVTEPPVSAEPPSSVSPI